MVLYTSFRKQQLETCTLHHGDTQLWNGVNCHCSGGTVVLYDADIACTFDANTYFAIVLSLPWPLFSPCVGYHVGQY